MAGFKFPANMLLVAIVLVTAVNSSFGQMDSTQKEALYTGDTIKPAIILSTQPVKANLSYYQQFYGDIKQTNKYRGMQSFKYTESKASSSKALGIAGTVLLSILGERSGHPYRKD